MHNDKNMSHEERVRIEIYEAKQQSIKWDEHFFHATNYDNKTSQNYIPERSLKLH